MPDLMELSGVVMVEPPASNANAAMAVDGERFMERIALILVTLRPRARALRESCFFAAFAGFFMRLVHRTLMMGATEAIVNIPKPSGELTAVENPIPMERTCVVMERKKEK